MKKKELQVQYMGGFALKWDGKPLYLELDSGSKPLQLLRMLLYYRDTGITRAFAIENLFDAGDSVNPVNNLRNTRFRMKKLLIEAGMPEVEYSLVKGGRLWWEQEIPVTIDVEQFEKAAQKALKETRAAQRLAAGLKACKLYTGMLLPCDATLPWVVVENERLHGMYAALVQECAASLEQGGDWMDAFGLYARAGEREPYREDWAMGQIRCLQGMGQHKAAVKLYEETAARLLNAFGVGPSEEMRACMDAAGDGSGFRSPMQIIECVREAAGQGARYCHFSEFVHSCSLVSRLEARDGRATSLLWCNLQSPQNEAEGDGQRKARAEACMLRTLSQTLRSSDLFTCYGDSQYLILLPGNGDEGCRHAFERLNTRFKAEKAAYGYTLTMTLVPLAQIE